MIQAYWANEMWMLLTVWASARAAVGVVTECVDVNAALGVGIIVAGDVPRDLGLGVFGVLLEVDDTLDLGVSTENGDWFPC